MLEPVLRVTFRPLNRFVKKAERSRRAACRDGLTEVH